MNNIDLCIVCIMTARSLMENAIVCEFIRRFSDSILRRYRPIVDTNTLQTVRYSSHLHVRVKAQRANKLSSEVEYNMYSIVS